jgi:DNA repair exonuclease SbcCD ATPase subunit
MFSYAEGNVVDFTKMRNIMGIFGKNTAGKSAILDAFMFCLFDKCSRAFKGIDIMNNRKKSFRCKLQFRIDDTDYFIERRAVKYRKDI